MVRRLDLKGKHGNTGQIWLAILLQYAKFERLAVCIMHD